MTQLLITGPIFALIAVGYIAVRSGLVPKAAAAGVGQFVLYFTVPALIFRALSDVRFDQVLDPFFLIAYSAGCVGTFFVSFLVFKTVFRKPVTESGLNAFGSSFPNSIFIGFPILLHLFDGVPAQAFTMALLVENFLLFPIAMIVMDIGSGAAGQGGLRDTLKAIGERLVKNPILIAIIAGVMASAVEVELPPLLVKVIDMLASASPAAALFFIGGVLVGIDLKGRLPVIGAVTFAKLVINPLLVAACIWLLPPFQRELQVAAIVIASAPMLAIFPIIGGKYGLEQESASTLLSATAVSFVTISVVLWLVL